MYTSLHIQNFRGLRDLRLDDLARVNLIVGANNVGKTSLLEALWLFQGAGNPALTVPLTRFRGSDAPPSSAESLWLGLFHRFSTEQPIAIEAVTSAGDRLALTVTLERAAVATTSLSGNGRESERPAVYHATTPDPELLRYRFTTSSLAEPITAVARVVDGAELRSDVSELTLPSAVLLGPSQPLPARQAALLFTRALDSGWLDRVTARARAVEPALCRFSLGLQQPSEPPAIRAHLDGVGHPVPLPLLGAGLRRLVELLLAIPSAAQGLALLDEVETGVHHRNLTPLWDAIDEVSREFDVQVFATTQSWECVGAAVEALVDRPTDFRMRRLEWIKGDLRAIPYDHEIAVAAVTGFVEVR